MEGRPRILSSFLPLSLRVSIAQLKLRLFNRINNLFLQEARPIAELPRERVEEIVNTVANSQWARRIAEGHARLAGLIPGSPEWNAFVAGYSKNVARRFLGLPAV